MLNMLLVARNRTSSGADWLNNKGDSGTSDTQGQALDGLQAQVNGRYSQQKTSKFLITNLLKVVIKIQERGE